jgi:iron donor protein CyaY
VHREFPSFSSARTRISATHGQRKRPVVFIIFGMLDELQFRKHSEQAFADLKKSLYAAEDSAEIEVEDQSGALHISFEDGARFVISPNAPVRQIWISALTTSFKLDWSEAEEDFVLAKTRETLKPLVGRLISQQLGEDVKLG